MPAGTDRELRLPPEFFPTGWKIGSLILTETGPRPSLVPYGDKATYANGTKDARVRGQVPTGY